MHINDSLCSSPHAMGGGTQGSTPALMQEREVSVYYSLIASCPVAMGWGMGGSTAPFFWHWSPFTKSP